MHNLRAGMYAAVGSTGGGDCDRDAGNAGQGRLESVLNSAAARLGLPAKEAAAVVFQT
jgi:hypothetical protein